MRFEHCIAWRRLRSKSNDPTVRRRLRTWWNRRNWWHRENCRCKLRTCGRAGSSVRAWCCSLRTCGRTSSSVNNWRNRRNCGGASSNVRTRRNAGTVEDPTPVLGCGGAAGPVEEETPVPGPGGTEGPVEEQAPVPRAAVPAGGVGVLQYTVSRARSTLWRCQRQACMDQPRRPCGWSWSTLGTVRGPHVRSSSLYVIIT